MLDAQTLASARNLLHAFVGLGPSVPIETYRELTTGPSPVIEKLPYGLGQLSRPTYAKVRELARRNNRQLRRLAEDVLEAARENLKLAVLPAELIPLRRQLNADPESVTEACLTRTEYLQERETSQQIMEAVYQQPCKMLTFTAALKAPNGPDGYPYPFQYVMLTEDNLGFKGLDDDTCVTIPHTFTDEEIQKIRAQSNPRLVEIVNTAYCVLAPEEDQKNLAHLQLQAL